MLLDRLALALPVCLLLPVSGTSQEGEALRAGIQRQEYEFQPVAGRPQAWSAPNRAHALRSRVSAGGLELFPRTSDASGAGAPWMLELRTIGLGRERSESLPCPSLSVAGPRATLDHGALHEWFVNGPAGIEQGWTIAERPAGEGPLRIEFELGGGFELELAGDRRAAFVRAEVRLDYAGLRAWDASGVELAARLGRGTRGPVIELDDAGALYPVTVDPTLSWTAEGDQADALFGLSVSGAGDVDGDGNPDVIVGAPRYDNGEMNEGRAFLYLGSTAGLSTTPAWTAESDQALAEFGRAVAGAGDVNNDTYDDVIVGAPFYENGGAMDDQDEGQVFVYLGGPSGLSTMASTLEGLVPGHESGRKNAHFGAAVCGAGDLNGDGFDDIAVGAPEYDAGQSDEGFLFTFMGGPPTMGNPSGLTEGQGSDRDEVNARLGNRVAAAGNVNGDAYDDLIVSAPFWDNGEGLEGSVFVYHGTSTGIVNAPAWMVESDQIDARMRAVAGAGDVNADGYDDVIVGAQFFDNGEMDEGRAFLYLGSASGLASTPAWMAESNSASSEFGGAVAGAGDVNGDGFADVLVGASEYPGPPDFEGRAYLYLGSASGLLPSSSFVLDGNQVESDFGQSLAGAGDVDGDGLDDFLIGAPSFESDAMTQANEGKAELYLGTADFGTVLYEQKISDSSGLGGELDADDVFGSSVAPLGDLNGDGIGDLAVSAHQDDDGAVNRGAVWILFLGQDGTVASSQKISSLAGGFTGELGSDNFGLGLAAPGDLDGDGVTELAVGEYRDHNQADRGAVWILFLNADGTVKAHQKINDTEGGFTGVLLDGNGFGSAIEPIGDLDQDGVNDIAVSAGYDDDVPDAGAVWILFLNTDGTVKAHQKISATQGNFTGPLSAGDNFGGGVASLGDLDGPSGSALTLAVSASGDDEGGSNVGAIWILSLSTQGMVLASHKITEGLGGFRGDLDPGIGIGSLENLGSVGGPGVVDLGVGAGGDDQAGSNAGAVWILSLDADGLVVGQTKLGEGQGGFGGDLAAGDSFGSGVAAIGDLDGDGRNDIAVGAQGDGDGGAAAGAVWICFLNDGTLNLGANATTWTGATDSDWTDPTNWSNGTPDMTKTAIIPDAATTPNDPVISVGGQQCNTLWIQSAGTLDISTGPELDSLGAFGGATVSGPITGGGNLVFEQAGTLAGAATIGLPDVRADADLSVQGGPLILTGTLTGNQGLAVELGAKLEVQTDVLVLGDLLLDGALSVGDSLDVGGILTSTSSGNVGSLEVGDIGACSGSVTVGQICFHGEVATSCPLHVENDSSSSSLVLDIAEGWPAGVSVDVPGGTITLESSDFSIGGDLVLESGTLAIGVDGTLDVAGAGGIVIEAPGTLDIGSHQTLVPAPAPITVRGKLQVGPGGELQLESNALVVEAGGVLCLSGGASNLAGIVGANGGGYALSVLDGATIAAKNFAFTGMGPSGITLERDALIEAAPLDLRNGLFDLPAEGGRLLALERSAPATLRYLVFENTNAAGTVNVHVPSTSELVTLVNWSGAFSGPTFEDDPGMKLDWGPPELTEATLSARWRPDHVLVAWTTTSEIDAEVFLLRRSVEPSGPFLDMHETPSTGPGSYSFADWTVAPGTAYRYRLHERLTHGVLVLLDEVLLPASELPVFLPRWGRQAPPAPPAPLPLVIGPAGSYPDVPSAVAALASAHAGEHVTLELAPGRHAAFELREFPFDLCLAAQPGALLDATLDPVRITRLPAGRSLELAGLAIDAGRPERLALAIEDSAGVVLLDGVAIEGTARLSAARAVAFQGGSVGGLLALERCSRAVSLGVTLPALVEPGSRCYGDLDAPRLRPSRGDMVTLEAKAGAIAWLLASTRLGFARRPGVAGGIALLDPGPLRVLDVREGIGGWTIWPASLGKPPLLYLQALVLVGGVPRLSNVLRVGCDG